MSGPGEDYSDDEINDVYDAISDAWEDYSGGGDGEGGGGGTSGPVGGPGGGGGTGGGGEGGGGPVGGPGSAAGGTGTGGLGAITVTGSGRAKGRITVTARVEWAGEYANNGRDGERTVKLDGVDTRPIVAALAKARALEIRAARGPLRSYTAKSPQARLRHLGSTRQGAAALKEAGFSPSRETLRRWAKGEQTPGKANQRRIAEAYKNVRNPGRGVQGARKAVTDALTASLLARYGSNVRFRDIREMRIH